MENSPLGRLSAELRNKISEFALIREKSIWLDTCIPLEFKQACALTWTVLFVDYQTTPPLGAWLHALGSQVVSRLKHIAFRKRNVFGDDFGDELVLYGLESGRVKAANTNGGEDDLEEVEIELEGLEYRSSLCRLVMTTLQDMGLKLRLRGILGLSWTQYISVFED